MTDSTLWMLDKRLDAEKRAESDLPLCRILLRDESRFPWVVLVPRCPNASESFDLQPVDRSLLWAEVDQIAFALRAVTGATKINIAAFGNMVPQLHVHVVARRPEDPAWPQSAVGWDSPRPYQDVPQFWNQLLATI